MRSVYCIVIIICVIPVIFISITANADRVRIVNVQTTAAPGYLDVNVTVHPDATRFDMKVVVHRILANNNLYFSLKLRVMPKTRRSFTTVYSLQRMPVCDFLRYADNHKVLQFMLKTNLPTTFPLRCPIRNGTFLIENLGINNTCMAQAKLDGYYRMYAEVMQLHEGVLKLLSLQITTEYTVETAAAVMAATTTTTTTTPINYK